MKRLSLSSLAKEQISQSQASALKGGDHKPVCACVCVSICTCSCDVTYDSNISSFMDSNYGPEVAAMIYHEGLSRTSPVE